MRIALVSCVNLPEPDLDEAPSMAALARAGHRAEAPGWDDPGVDWAGYDMAVLRATWNYPFKCAEFLAWIDRVSAATTLVNSAEVVRWNADKRYLLELEAKGVTIVPTHAVERGAGCDVGTVARERAWPSVVVKPRIGAGSWRTRRFGPDEFAEASAFARTIGADGDVLVQEARAEFDEPGERSIVCIGGEPTHAIVKQPRFDEQDESVALDEPASSEERALISKLLAMVPEPVLYARVDVIPTAQGPMLSELELIEPSLFFPQCPAALETFVRAVEQWGGPQ